MTSTADARHTHRRGQRAWTWAGSAVAATVAVVLLAPAPLASADPVVPPGGPCQSQLQALDDARQAVDDHNAEGPVDPTPEQAEQYNAAGEALAGTQEQAGQAAQACINALAGRASAEAGEEDQVEKMHDKIYDWFKENLERVEKYQEKQQEEQEKQQEEQHQDRCGDAQPAPPTTPSATAPSPAPPICPAAPTTTTPAPGTF